MKNIIITGNSSGIGYGLSQYYMNKGYHVIGISRRLPDLKIGNKHSHIQFDLSDFEGIRRELKDVLLAYDSFEKVILNAGILGKIDDLKHQSLEDIYKIMNINVWANKVLLDVLFDMNISIQQVIAISSGSAIKASRGWGPYSISKAALNTLINSYSKEYHNTHFCSMAPGLVDTEIQQEIRSLNTDERFPSIELLQNASGTSTMPDYLNAAPMLADAFDKAMEFQSGSYLDVRNM